MSEEPGEAGSDVVMAEPGDTLSPAVQDTLPPAAQDTLSPATQDTLSPTAQDTVMAEPGDMLPPTPQDTLPRIDLSPQPTRLDTVDSPARDRIPPHLRDAVFPGENRPPEPRESIFPERPRAEEAPPADTLRPLSPDQLPELPDTLEPALPDTGAPAQPDTLDPALPDTLQPIQPDTLQSIQPDTLQSIQPDTLPPQPRDTLSTEPPDTLQAPPSDLQAPPEEPDRPAADDTTAAGPPETPDGEEEGPDAPPDPPPVITPLPDISLPGFRLTETDSTNRWNMALNRVDRIYRDPGVITYRTGRLGVPSGVDIHTYELRHQKLLLNDMRLASPVTGQVNWNRVPIHKIRTIEVQERSFLHQTAVQLREHYTVQPMTFLNFDEGTGDYRNLEFSFAHNFTPQTHLELSFWDRRDGDLLPRNGMEGRQIVAKGRHHLDERYTLKVGYINNGLDQEQSFGYNIPDPALYHFNPYGAQALETNAESNTTTNDLYVHIQQRIEEDAPISRALGINYQTEAWNLSYSQDTTAWSLRDVRAFFWQEWQIGDSRVRGRADGYAMRDRSGRSLSRTTWLGWNSELDAEVSVLPMLSVGVSGSAGGRSGRVGYTASGSVTVEPFPWMRVEGYGGLGSLVPDLQPLYWQSESYRGNRELTHESGYATGVLAEVDLGRWFRFGMRTGAREVRNGIFPDPEGTFVNIDPYATLATSAWLDLDSPRLEGHLSATIQEFATTSSHPVNMQLNQGGQRMWFKGSFYWKNYVFNRAAYIKAGLTGMISPGGYASADYRVPMNRWQHGGEARLLPDFHRLDVDLSARIRWFMLLIRYENVLDGVQQLGYFETDGYPMPGRRFLLGVRIVFTN